VQAELNHTPDYKSDLRTELEAFRKHFTPGKMNTPGMHFNYQDLYHAYDRLENRWKELVYGDNYSKCWLFCRQVIGFEQRNLPARDRQIYASGLYYVVDNVQDPARSFELKKDKGQIFPNTANLGSHSGLGFDFYIDIYGASEVRAGRGKILGSFTELVSSKSNKLANLCSNSQRKKHGV
jgi:hypothetical protein